MSDLSRLLNQQRLDAIVSPKGCPIAVLPVLNLALVCRCLNSADLLAVYKSSRTMQAAASHPLAFQHGNRFTVDPWREGVRCEGPSAVCRSLCALQSALQSRRFSSFRLLTLLTDSTSLHPLVDSPSSPALHSLSVRIDYRSFNVDLSAMFRIRTGVSSAPCFAYLRVLSITCGKLMKFEHRDATALPPRLELLQLQPQRSCAVWTKEQQMNQVFALIPVELGALLAPLTLLRQLVVRDGLFNAQPSKSSEPPLAVPPETNWQDLLTLAAIEAEAPQIDSISWMVEVDYNDIARAMSEFSKERPDAAWPKLNRVRTLQIKRVAALNESNLAPNPLLLFPALTELRYKHQASNQATAGRYQGLMLNQLCAAQLSSLTHLTLTEAGPSPFSRTGWTVTHGFDLAPVLRSLPRLTSLSVTRLRIDSLSVFRFAPQLRILRDLFWPVPHELVKAEEMAACFPSLTELTARAFGLIDAPDRKVYSPLDAALLRPVLCALPHLLRVSINAAPLCRPIDLSSVDSDTYTQTQLLRLQEHREREVRARERRAGRELAHRHALAAASVATPTTERGAEMHPLLTSAGPGAGIAGAQAAGAAIKPAGGPAGSTAATGTIDRGADPAAVLLFAFAAGADVKSAGAADVDTAASANSFIFAPPPNQATPADAAAAFSFGPAAAQANPFAAPFSIAPVAVAPGGPSIAADPTPLPLPCWTAAAASTSASPTFALTHTALTQPTAAPPVASLAPSLTAPASSSAFAFSAPPSAFAAAAPSAAANPFSSPFVFAAPAGSPFAAAAPAGLPDLAGFNPFVAASSSASFSAAFPAASCSPLPP